ncbi:MAG: hypothetical protein QNJ98_13755 [Planctomycetota bacterium]|nr:hypothetical protein [Planctomycetota bacterium]
MDRSRLPAARRALAFACLFLGALLGGCGGGGGAGAAPPPPPPGPGPGPTPGNPVPLSFVNWEVPPVHPLDLHPGADLLVLAHTADHRLEVFDLSSGQPVWQASIPVGLAPVSARFRTATEVWVVNHISDTVSVVDLAAGRVTQTIATDDEPCDVVFAGTPERAFVSCSQVNRVQVFDPSNPGAAPASIDILGEDPRALAVSPDGSRVYVGVFESGNCTSVLGGGIIENNPIVPGDFFPPNVVNDPAGPHGGVNPPPNDGVLFDPLPNPANPAPPAVALIVKKDTQGSWFDDNGGDWTALVSGVDAAKSGRPVGWDLPDRDLATIDAGTLGVTYTTGLMNICMAVGVNPVSSDVTVVGTDAINEVRYEPKVNGIFVRVLAAVVDDTTLATPSAVDLNPHLTYTTGTVVQSERDKSLGDPRGVAFNPLGTRMYVTGMGSNNVVVLNAAGARVGAGTPIEVGEGPLGLVYDGARDQLYVWNRFGGSISVVDALTETETTQVSIFDPTPPAIRAGRPHLYDTHKTSGLGHVSCASCHVDARMDRLAWDLGDPGGSMKSTSGQNCSLTGLLQTCNDWHSMKGPMTTQTLQDIIGHEPHHWRGDREGIEAFNGAFSSLLADDTGLTPVEMQQFEDFLATIHFPPNPYRHRDNTLPTDLPLPGHFTPGRFGPAGLPLPNGDAVSGLDLYRTGNLDGGVVGAQCVTCHTLPTGLGTDHLFFPNLVNPGASTYSIDPILPGPMGERHKMLVSLDGSTNITIKVPHLRNMYDKVGFEMTQTENTAGFGFLHDGSIDSLARFVAEPLFNVTSVQQVADLVAFMLAFSGSDLPTGVVSGPSEPPGGTSLDAHAAVGWQLTYIGGAVPADLTTMIGLADAGVVDLIAKGVEGGIDRGWVYDRIADTFISDRDGEEHTQPALFALAGAGTPMTFTVVPAGLGVRLGIDRDEDGFGDRTELDAGADPTAQTSTP